MSGTLESKTGFQGDLGATVIRDGRAIATRELNTTPLLSKLRLSLKRVTR